MSFTRPLWLLAVLLAIGGMAEAATYLLFSNAECHTGATGSETINGDDPLVVCPVTECDPSTNLCERRNRSIGGDEYYWCSCFSSIPFNPEAIGCTVITIENPPAERITKCNDAAICGAGLGCKKKPAGGMSFSCECK